MALLRNAVDDDQSSGGSILREELEIMLLELESGIINHQPSQLMMRMERRIEGRGQDPNTFLSNDVTEFMDKGTYFQNGTLATETDKWFAALASLRQRALALKADSTIAGTEPLERLSRRMMEPFATLFSAGETAVRSVTPKTVALPDDRTERFDHLSVVIRALHERVNAIALELDTKHAANEKRRRGAVTLQTKEASEKAAKDKAAKDKAAKEPAAKLRANAATYRRRCWKCGKDHDASACHHTGKVCNICEGDHLRADCPEAGNGAAQTR
jgi:hypothetical protein